MDCQDYVWVETGKKNSQVAGQKTRLTTSTDMTPRGNLLRDKTLEGPASGHYRIADSTILIFLVSLV